MRNNYPKRPSGEPPHTLSKLYDAPVGFVPPTSHLRQCLALIVVAEGRLFLGIGWFILFSNLFWNQTWFAVGQQTNGSNYKDGVQHEEFLDEGSIICET